MKPSVKSKVVVNDAHIGRWELKVSEKLNNSHM